MKKLKFILYFIGIVFLSSLACKSVEASISQSNHTVNTIMALNNPTRILLKPPYNEFVSLKLKMCCDNTGGTCNTGGIVPVFTLCYGTLSGGCVTNVETYSMSFNSINTMYDCRPASSTTVALWSDYSITFQSKNPYNINLSTTTQLLIQIDNGAGKAFRLARNSLTYTTGSSTTGYLYASGGGQGLTYYDLYTTNEQLINATSTYSTTTITGSASSTMPSTSSTTCEVPFTESLTSFTSCTAVNDQGVNYTTYYFPFLGWIILAFAFSIMLLFFL